MFVVAWTMIGSAPMARQILPAERFDIRTPQALTVEELKRLIADAHFLVVRRLPYGVRVSEEVIRAGKKLKLIQKIGIRLDYIDVKAAARARIPVAAIPAATDCSVADHAILMILALSKNLVSAHKSVVNAEYLRLGLRPKQTTETEYAVNWVKLPTFSVYGKTLGLVGMGEIGGMVVRRAQALGMKVVYFKPNRLSKLQEKKLGVAYRSLNELLRESDFVSLHAPHTKETEKLIGPREFSLMKRTAFLINTARGGEVDEHALCQALESRRIAGAGLDVFMEEPVSVDNPLLRLRNVILTPHIAGGGQIDLALRSVCDNITRVAQGRKPMNVARLARQQ